MSSHSPTAVEGGNPPAERRREGDVMTATVAPSGGAQSTQRCEDSGCGSSTQPEVVSGATTSAVAAPTRCHQRDSTPCWCPMCTMSYYITLTYSNQRQSSRHVMVARPSPCFAETGGIPPPPVPLLPLQLMACPLMEEYGFCTYGKFCTLPHPPVRQPLVPRPATLEEALQLTLDRVKAESGKEFWKCAVCGFDRIDEASQGKVGELYLYRVCSSCAIACYFPHVQYIIDLLIDAVGDDYQLYKTKIDEYRKLLPDVLKIPLTHEAHRMGYTVFAWSLVSPADARDALNVALASQPDIEAIASVGSGTGYVEHLFNRVANGAGARPQGPSPELSLTSSFDGVHSSNYPQNRIYFFAFDELARPTRYSVTVVVGGPTAVLSMNCLTTALLLCWPPFGSPQEEQSSMGFETLEYFTQAGGKTVIFIGDIFSSGDWRLHELLYSHYKLLPDYPVRRELRRWLPMEMGLIYAGNDTIGVYTRRDVPLPPQQWAWGRR